MSDSPISYSKKYKSAILVIIPVLFASVSFFCLLQNKTFFASYPDSIYIYLINGMNIAGGNWEIGHFDNPGTPVHLLGGLIIYIAHLFIGNGAVYEDVLSNPERYLKIIVEVLLILLVLSTYFAGRLAFKHTQNIRAALLFQLLPACSFFAIMHLLLIRLCPENITVIILVGYYAYLWTLCYRQSINKETLTYTIKHVLLFAFISAFLITSKIVCLPLVIIPFFFLKRVLLNSIYLFFTLIFSSLLLMPVWGKLPFMYDWFFRLATHSGHYGQGEAGVSIDMLLQNILKIFEHEAFFTLGYIAIIVFLIVGLVSKKYRSPFYKLLLSFGIICSAQIALASKQYGNHYLLASHLCIIPALSAIVFLFFEREEIRKKAITFLLTTCFCWFGYKMYSNVEMSYTGGKKMFESSLHHKKYDAVPKIITTGYQGSSFVESAIRFGSSYGGANYNKEVDFLRKQFPVSYFFDLHLNDIIVKGWGENYTPAQLFEKHDSILVYFREETEDTERSLLNKLTQAYEQAVNVSMIESNKTTGEKIYLLKTDILKQTERVRNNFLKKLGSDTTFLIKTYNGLYISINSETGEAISQKDSQQAALFGLIQPGYGTVALKAANKYACAERNNNDKLFINREFVGNWESFQLFFDDKESTYSFQTLSGKFVSYDKATSSLAANAPTISNSEKFYLIPVSAK